MKKVSFNDKVKIYKFDDDYKYCVEEIKLQKDLTIEQQYKENFHNLVIYSIFNNGVSSIRSKQSWWKYLKLHPYPNQARHFYHKNMINCLYKLTKYGIYKISLQYNKHLLKQHISYYCLFLNHITLLGNYANKIIKAYRKYKNKDLLTNRTVENNNKTE